MLKEKPELPEGLAVDLWVGYHNAARFKGGIHLLPLHFDFFADESREK